MAAKPLEASVRQRQGAVVVDLHGQIDGFAQDALNNAYAQATSKDPHAILLNFAGVGYINSTGIALIVELLAKARAARRHVFACGLSDHYQEVFAITRLTDFMDIVPDEATAMRGATER